MIDDILDACREVLEINGDPQSPYWLASQMVEMKMWRASEHDVRAALEKNISECGQRSWFVKVADDEWALSSWNMEDESNNLHEREWRVPQDIDFDDVRPFAVTFPKRRPGIEDEELIFVAAREFRELWAHAAADDEEGQT